MNAPIRAPAQHPSPEQIKALRLERGQTQAQAAASVFCTDRAWRFWEAGDRRMHQATWALYQRGEQKPRRVRSANKSLQ